MLKNISKLFTWIKDRIKHKLEHFKPSRLIETFKKHGIALLVIIIVWEIIEDIMFPLLFIWLGNNVNPWFITGAPLSWLLCLHPIVVPATWALWVKIRGNNE
jgi:hypothetical protein